MNRKEAIKKVGLTTIGLASIPSIINTLDAKNAKKTALKGNINHSVCRWPYSQNTLEQVCEAAQSIGIKSVELLYEEEWNVVKKYGLTCAMVYGSKLPITVGFNDPKLHSQYFQEFSNTIPKAAEQGFKSMICFSGNRNGIDDVTGLENCAKGIEPILKIAQKYDVTICMEVFNSKRDHPDYQADNTKWSIALVEKLGSSYFKLLYDIYHMQIMEGDIIATIQKYGKYFGHYHTGGVPGRREIDETQELFYPAIMHAIVKTGYKGFVGQEFIPSKEEPFQSLRQAIQICDV
ncbi:MAG: TIM barrel protein [Chitinophagaceae bacterium]|nr:TIM barrel protein [Chitinophagaceae bacterium]